jgi:hypothetical protein
MSSAPIHDYPIRDEILWQFGPRLDGLDVLEIGPGSGYTAWKLAPRVEQMVVADISSLPRIDWVLSYQADFTKPGAQRTLGKFDFIYSLDMLECVKIGEGAQVFENIRECLKSMGTALVTFPNHSKFPNKYENVNQLIYEMRVGGIDYNQFRITTVELRGWAQFWYKWGHDVPMGILRDLRKSESSMNYEQTWAFKKRNKLDKFKTIIHGYWSILNAIIKLGGPAYRQKQIKGEISGKQILIRIFA